MATDNSGLNSRIKGHMGQLNPFLSRNYFHSDMERASGPRTTISECSGIGAREFNEIPE